MSRQMYSTLSCRNALLLAFNVHRTLNIVTCSDQFAKNSSIVPLRVLPANHSLPHFPHTPNSHFHTYSPIISMPANSPRSTQEMTLLTSQTESRLKKQIYLMRQAQWAHDEGKYLAAWKSLTQIDLGFLSEWENAWEKNPDLQGDESREMAANIKRDSAQMQEKALSLKGKVLIKLNKPFEALPVLLRLFHVPHLDRTIQLQCASELVKIHESLYCYEDALFYSNYILDEDLREWLKEKVRLDGEYAKVYTEKIREGMRREIVFSMAQLLPKETFLVAGTSGADVSDSEFESIRHRANKHMLKYTLRSQYKSYHPHKPLPSQWEKQWNVEQKADIDRIVNLSLWRETLTAQLDTIKTLVEFVNNCTIIGFCRKKVLCDARDSVERVRHVQWTLNYEGTPFIQFEYYSEYDAICEETLFCKNIYLLRGTEERQLLWFEQPYSKIDTHAKRSKFRAVLETFLREKQWAHVSANHADLLYDVVTAFAKDGFHATCSLSGNQNHTTPDKVPPLTIFVRPSQSNTGAKPLKFTKIEQYQDWFHNHREVLRQFTIQFHRNVSITGPGQSFASEDRDKILFAEERAEVIQTAALIRIHARDLLKPKTSEFARVVGELIGR